MKPLRLIAETDSKRGLSHIFVMDGFVYVSNGKALIKIPTKEVFGDVVFEKGEVLLFEASLWANMKFHTATMIVREGMEFRNLTSDTYLRAKTPKEASVQVPNFDDVMPNANKPVVTLSYIGLNPEVLTDTAKALGIKKNDLEHFTYQFYGLDKHVEVFHPMLPTMRCIVMPCKTENPPVKKLLSGQNSTNTVPATKGSIGEVLEIVDKYKDVKHAILSDYLMEDGIVTELNAAIDNMVTSINEIEVEEEPEPDEDEKNNTEPSLDDFCEEDILDHLREKDFSIIKIDNLADKIKLETFIENELYPLYADRLSKTSL